MICKDMKQSIIADVSSRPHAIKRYVLGLFILIQLAFIFIANVGSVAFYFHFAIATERPRYLAYMGWRSRNYLAARGDQRVPKQIDLVVSIHTLSRYNRPSVPEFELQVLRWRPNLAGNDALQLCVDSSQDVQCE